MSKHEQEPIEMIQTWVEEATFDYAMGENEEALRKLEMAVEQAPDSFDAWHAMTEVYFSQKDYDQALAAAEKAQAICPGDVHINTSLSRIWMEKGNKKQAEHFGAQARILGWKAQLKADEAEDGSLEV